MDEWIDTVVSTDINCSWLNQCLVVSLVGWVCTLRLPDVSQPDESF